MAYIGPQPKIGQNREVDDISSGFNGSTTAFTLQVAGSNASPGSANNIIVSVNGIEELKTINQFITHLPAFDSRYLRAAYLKMVPGLDMTQYFTCDACGFEKEVDIPLTVDFFWAKQ